MNKNTQIFNSKQIKEAAELIKQGENVAFPTETVYGLGADATNSEAIKKIFIAKKRPQDNPLIIHVSDIEQVKKICHLNENAEKLIKEFWPGPLTLVLKKKKNVPKEITAGLKTVAVRMPNNEIALSLIKLAGTPIAAPSANISGRPSSTNFEHVKTDLFGRVAGIIKGKKTTLGIESSVIDLTNKPILLRPGGISLEDIQKILPQTTLYQGKTTNKSPGMKYTHYSPKAKIILFEKTNGELKKIRSNLKKQGYKVKEMKLDNSEKCSRDLFKKFRDCDEEKIDYLLINAVSENGIGLAIMNRVRKAATQIIK